MQSNTFLTMPITLIKAGLKLVLCDRGMFFTDFFLATSLPFFVQYLVWSYIYQSHSVESISGYSYSETLAYFAIAILIGRLNNGYDIISRSAYEIHEGQLELRLARLFTLYQKNFFEFLGGSILYVIPVIFSLLICASIGFKPIYFQPIFWVLLALQLALSQFLIFNLSWLLASTNLWLVKGFFIANLLAAFQSFFGAELLPISFWPTWLTPLLKYNPFYFINGALIDSFLQGKTALLMMNCFYTFIYAVFFFFTAKKAWRVGLKKYSGAAG